MMKNLLILLFLLLSVYACLPIEIETEPEGPINPIEEIKAPYYFIAIHNEPCFNDFQCETTVGHLKKMTDKAASYKIKLTIMLAAQFADYLTSQDISEFKSQGHEIAVHHHSIFHRSWDGYSNFSSDKIQQETCSENPATCMGLPLLGDLNDFMDKLYTLDQNITSGCVNDEHDKNSMPDQIIYDTCSGYSNQYSKIGELASDQTDPEKGVNEFILRADVNGISRKWLAHSPIAERSMLDNAKEQFKLVENKHVYGVVNHSLEGEYQYFEEYLEMLHEVDPQGQKSKTIKEIINEQLLPVEDVEIKMVREEDEPVSTDDCDINGDGIIDQVEQRICANGIQPVNFK